MIIKSLKLNNIGAIGSCDLQFSKGLNVILGKNGSGKSTVLDSIAYMINSYTRGTVQKIVSWGEDNGDIAIEWEHEGVNYEETAHIAKSAVKNLNVNYGELPLESTSEVNKYLKEIFEPKLTQLAMFHLESENDLITMTPATRREYLKKVYDLNFTDQLKEIKDTLTPLTKRSTELQGKIAVCTDREFVKRNLLDLPLSEEMYVSLKSNREQNQKELQECVQKINSIQKDKQQIDSLSKELESIKSLYDGVQRQIRSVEVWLANGPSFSNEEALIEKCQQELDLLSPVRLPVFDAEALTSAKMHLTEVTVEKNQALESFNLAKSGKCPTCARPFSTEDLSTHEEALNKVTEVVDSVRKTVAEYEEDKQFYEEKIVEFNAYKAKKEQGTQELQRAKDNLQHKKALYASERKNKEEMKVSLESQAESYLTQQEKLSTQLTQCQADEGSLPSLYERKLALERDINRDKADIDSYDSVSQQNASIEMYNHQLEEDEKANEALRAQCVLDLKGVTEEITLLKREEEIWKREFPNFMISHLSIFIENTMNDFLEKTYDGRYKVKLESSDKTDTLDILYGAHREDVRYASGYEKALFSISYKDSFNRVKQLGCIFLDEVDKQADVDYSKKFFEVIGSMTKDYEQIFIITHKTESKQFLIEELGAKCFIVKDGTVEETTL